MLSSNHTGIIKQSRTTFVSHQSVYMQTFAYLIGTYTLQVYKLLQSYIHLPLTVV